MQSTDSVNSAAPSGQVPSAFTEQAPLENGVLAGGSAPEQADLLAQAFEALVRASNILGFLQQDTSDIDAVIGRIESRAGGTAWVDLTDEDRDRAFNTLPDMLEGFMKKWGWLHFAKAIEDICREKNEKRDNPPPTPNVYDEEWVCEEHPEKPMGHDGCKGAGMLSDESIKRLGIAGRDGGRSNG